MLTRREMLFKWALYAAAAALCLLIQGALLRRITLWGVIPFLYPLLAILPATYEGPRSGAVFALCLGVLCDVLLPDLFPCLYTLTFPVAALLTGLMARSLLPAGIRCTVAAAPTAFALTDLLRCFILALNGSAAWGAGLSVMLREFLVTLPLAVPATWLFRAVHRKVHEND